MELLVSPLEVDLQDLFHEDFLLEKGERIEWKGTETVEEKEHGAY